jgi:hypothetical protein
MEHFDRSRDHLVVGIEASLQVRRLVTAVVLLKLLIRRSQVQILPGALP